MGRQVDKSRNKSLTEVKDKLEEEKAKPVTAEEDKNVKQGSLFSFANCLVLLLTVILAVLVPSAIVKTAELQELNNEQDQTIENLGSEAESLKLELEKSFSESVEKAESTQTFIKSLQTEKQALTAKINDLDLQALSKNKMLKDYQKNEITLNGVNKKNEDQIQNLTVVMNSKIDKLEVEKKDLLNKLKNVQQENSNLQQIHELALTSIKTEKESATKQLNQVLLKKEEEILTNSKTIKSLQEQSAELSNEKLELSKENKSFNMKNTQLSDELVGKTKTIESLKQENGKLSNDMVLFRAESSKTIDILENKKKNAIQESDTSKESYLKDIMKKEGIIQRLKEEKQILEKTCNERIATMENEHKTKLDILHNSRGQMMEILKSETENLNRRS
eukprot:GFUD01045063.1.p1 GENE.GFUD01045063.1~~GFUD01045063.1.p1  ORF type:complete len:391 (+),score=125.58 GFUD01045063.1:85-1257(+)